MKKLLLILILLLSFTLIGNCAWLGSAGEWDYRIEITLPDYAGDIGGAVTWFPVEVFLTATQAEEVFAELTTDAEYKKIQFTQADGTSLLYGHMKVFDVAGTKGIFTVSATGWTIDGNTSIFLYYDKDHLDNNTYIGATNTAACEAVYNAEYDAVYPMDDGADESHIYDATSNNNDGTKLSANNPVEAAGKIGQGQDFSTDYINLTSMFTGTAGAIEAWIKTSGNNATIVSNQRDDGDNDYLITWVRNNKLSIYRAVESDCVAGTVVVNDNSWHHVVISSDGNQYLLYVDGEPDALSEEQHNDGDWWDSKNSNTSAIGASTRPSTWAYFSGLMDELRVSSTIRSAAWWKGIYNSGNDDLFTYGSQETEVPVGITWNGVVISKWNGVTITIPINTQ